MQIQCASRGWNHPSLISSYYPDDLPEDWRLSYYANEFRSVLIPESEWKAVSEQDVEDWCEDVPETFRFFFEVQGDHKGLADVLGSRFGGLVDSATGKLIAHTGEEGTSVEVLRDLQWNDLKLVRQAIDDIVRHDSSVQQLFLFLDHSGELYKSLTSVQMLLELSDY